MLLPVQFTMYSVHEYYILYYIYYYLARYIDNVYKRYIITGDLHLVH